MYKKHFPFPFNSDFIWIPLNQVNAVSQKTFLYGAISRINWELRLNSIDFVDQSLKN